MLDKASAMIQWREIQKSLGELQEGENDLDTGVIQALMNLLAD